MVRRRIWGPGMRCIVLYSGMHYDAYSISSGDFIAASLSHLPGISYSFLFHSYLSHFSASLPCLYLLTLSPRSMLITEFGLPSRHQAYYPTPTTSYKQPRN